MAEFPINIHLNAFCEGCVRSLDRTHNPGERHAESLQLFTTVAATQLLGAQADGSSLTG